MSSFIELDRYGCIRRCGVPLSEGDIDAGRDRHVECHPTQKASVPPVVAPRASGKPETLTSSKDGATQTAGATSGLPTAGTRRRQAFDALRGAGSAGLTFDELCAKLGREYSHVGPRVRELVRDGHVVKQGVRYARSGSLQDVWVTTGHAEPTPDEPV